MSDGWAPAPSVAPLLEVRGLSLEYATARGPLRAVDGISFDVADVD